MSKHDGTTTPTTAATAGPVVDPIDSDREELGVWFNRTPSGFEVDTDPAVWSPEDRAALVEHMRAVWPAILDDVVRRRSHPAWCSGERCMTDVEEVDDRWHQSALLEVPALNALDEPLTVVAYLEQHADSAAAMVCLEAGRNVRVPLEAAVALVDGLWSLVEAATGAPE